MDVVYMGTSRYYGTMFVVFVAALWIQRSQESESYRLPIELASLSPCPCPPCPRTFGNVRMGGCCRCIRIIDPPLLQAGAAAQWLRANHYDRVTDRGNTRLFGGQCCRTPGPLHLLSRVRVHDTFIRFRITAGQFHRAAKSRLGLRGRFARARQPFLIFLGVRPSTPDEMRPLSAFPSWLRRWLSSQEPKKQGELLPL